MDYSNCLDLKLIIDNLFSEIRKLAVEYLKKCVATFA